MRVYRLAEKFLKKFEKFEKLLDKFRKESIINTRVTTEAENASESFKVCFCKEKEKTLKKMKKAVDKHLML